VQVSREVGLDQVRSSSSPEQRSRSRQSHDTRPASALLNFRHHFIGMYKLQTAWTSTQP
jgi:hypothetical protein